MGELVASGTWVEIHSIVLTADQRAGHIPADTKRVPLEMRAKGFLVTAAALGDRVEIVTVTGRRLDGTEVLAALEGLERGPAGNTSLAAAFVIAQELDENQIIIVQETEYTGAGKHPIAQLNLAKQMGVEVRRGEPRENQPGKRIVIPKNPSQLAVVDVDLDHLRRSYLRHAVAAIPKATALTENDIKFLADETRTAASYVEEIVHGMLGTTG
jgi:hypothetical protein